MLLNQPGRIGALCLKNRVVMAPLGTNFGTTDGYSTERDKLYYAERARGGVAMIMTEAMVITETARQHNNSLLVTHDKFIPGLASVVSAIKDNGALAVGQISHRGGLLRRSVLDMEPKGPSAWVNPGTGDPVRPLTVAEIVQIETEYVTAARRMQRAGYDGVELHAANGYLFHQFFSPRINHRTDQYGGSIDNRMRFLLETVARIKDELPELPLIVRFSVTEYVDGGYTEEEVVSLARALQRAGVDALDLSGGTNESPELSRFCIQPPSFPRGCLEPFARPIKQAVSIPVIVAGRIVEPHDAERILAAGSADFISIGRALVADAYWCAKAFGEVKTPIRRCISCNVCFERITLEKDICCVQNPMVGTEFESLESAEPQHRHARAASRDTPEPKRVLILGAGIAGIEAARMAAARGHHVEVWEKAAVAGGQMPLALAAPDKKDVEGVWFYRWEQIQSLGVQIRYQVEATERSIAAYRPDVVMVATGSRPRAFPISVPPHIKAVQAWDVLRDGDPWKAGMRVTILGGGMVGIETAHFLSARGCKVTVVERLPQLAKEMARNNRMDIVLRLKACGTRIETNVQVQAIEGNAMVATKDGKGLRIEIGDCLVCAVGPEPNRDVFSVVENTGVPYVLIGDCNQPGDFLSAIRDAWMAAISIDHGLSSAAANAAPVIAAAQ
jgi:2,4-dienoyl-CoA reductase-like NADH-dependent reductase (Old Yellow Enzyme family)/thioredoxin reductase